MTEKKFFSADSLFFFEAIQPKRKHQIDKISIKGRFRTDERVQDDFLCNEIDYKVI